MPCRAGQRALKHLRSSALRPQPPASQFSSQAEVCTTASQNETPSRTCSSALVMPFYDPH